MKLKQIACDIQQVIEDHKALQKVISRTGRGTLSFHYSSVVQLAASGPPGVSIRPAKSP